MSNIYTNYEEPKDPFFALSSEMPVVMNKTMAQDYEDLEAQKVISQTLEKGRPLSVIEGYFNQEMVFFKGRVVLLESIKHNLTSPLVSRGGNKVGISDDLHWRAF